MAVRGAGAAARTHAAPRRAHEHRRGRCGRPVRVAAFAQGLQELGWTIGRNLRIEYRWSAGEADRIRRYAAEISAFSPDVIIASGGAHAAAVQQAAPTVPIVFLSVNDPVAAGLVASLARPGGTATGFTALEFGTSPKWLELLKQIAPGVTRVAVLRPANIGGVGQLGAIQGAAASLGVEVGPVDLRDVPEMERAITALARGPNGGLLVVASALGMVHRALIIELAARHRLPAIYAFRVFVAAGGLISYGPDLPTSIAEPHPMSIASSRARSPVTFRYRRRRNSSW